MTLNLTLTPDADTASVLARVTTNSTGVTLVRADQNGTVPVRLQEGQALESGTLTVRDYEAALVGPVTYIATTTAPAELRRNLWGNTRGNTLTHWTAQNSTVELVPSGGPEGVPTYFRMKPTVTNGSWFRVWGNGPSVRGKVEPGSTVTVSYYVRVNRQMQVRVGGFQQNSAGSNTGETAATVTVQPSSAWTRVSTTMLIRSDSIYFTPYSMAPASTTGDVVEVTGFLLEQSSKLRPYFDGTSPGAEFTAATNVTAAASIIRGIETVEASTDLTAVRADMVSVVAQPQYVAAARVTVGQAFARPTKSVRHDIIGRPDPVFTLRRGGFRTGTVRVMVEDLGSYEMFDALQQQAAVCLFRFAAHEQGGRAAVDFYAVIEDLSSDTAEGTRALDLTLRVAEVRRPSGFLLGAIGWTYGALAGLGLTYAAVPANFNTYADLAIGTEAS